MKFKYTSCYEENEHENPPVFDKLQDLNEDTGVELSIKYLDSLFKRDELSEVYERYIKFDRYEKKDQDKMEDLTLEFEKLYNRIKQKSMELPEVVLGFELLDASKIPHWDRQLVLTGVDYSQKESLFVHVKMSLKKFHGEQSMSTGVSAEGCSNKPIELELGSEVLYSRDIDNFRKRQYGGFNKWRGRNFVAKKGQISKVKEQ